MQLHLPVQVAQTLVQTLAQLLQVQVDAPLVEQTCHRLLAQWRQAKTAQQEVPVQGALPLPGQQIGIRRLGTDTALQR
ncbi:hypothetical protein D3C76_1564030 [compost metagenome]